MAIEAELADGRILEFPDGTDPKVIQDAVKRLIDNPLSGVTTEKLKAIPSAPSTLRDLNETAAMSLAGGIKGLSDLFGVDNTVSKYFGEKQTQALKQMTPERLRELQIEEELANRAEGKPLEEFTTAGRAFLRSPAQGLVGGAFSSVPIIAATALAPAVTLPAAMTARLGTGIAGRIAGKAASASPAIAVGAGMGVGSQKGQDYEAVKKAMLERGASEEEAEMAAQKAAEYSAENAARQAASGIAGGLEGAIGVESVLGRMGRGRSGVDGSMTAPTWKGAAVQSTIGEAIPEAIQAATGAVGTNVALQQAGFDRDLTAGVIGQVTNDALTGALLGTAVTPLQKMSMQAEFDKSQLERDQQKRQKEQETIDKVREQLGVDKQLLALPAPAQRIEEPPVTDVLNAPFGSFARNELPPEVVQYIDDHRAQMGRPGALPAYSIEDIKDAMPGINPEGEAAYIDSLLTAKSGYTGDITYNPKTVMDVAGQKNVATGTKGFADFLTRVTGVGDLNSMSQPQLHAAFTALTNLPNPEEGSTQTILPEGTNALRFSDDQFKLGYEAILDEIAASAKNEISPAQAIGAIKAKSGIKNDADAKRVFDLSLKGGAIDVNKEGNVTAPAGLESLPAGYEVREGTFKQGEQQEYAINAGERPLEGIPTFADQQQAAEKLATLEEQRQKQAELADKKIEALQKKLQDSQENLDGMEAAGEANTQEYKVASAAHDALTKDLNGRMLTLQNRRDKLLQPLSIQPAGMKMVTRQGFTVFENGAPKATFPTKDAAIDSVVLGLPDERLNEAAAGKLPSQRTVARKAKVELDRRQGKAEPGIKVRATEPEQKTVKQKEIAEKTKQMAEVLNKALKKFGLEDVGLKIIAGMQDEGSYAGRLIKIALDADNPMGVLRHESIHALKDMGFFTPDQWAALERMAKSKWVDQYLKSVPSGRTLDTKNQPVPENETRFDAYVDIYGGNMNDVIEEAIADAFRDFDVNKAPPGMLTSLLKRMKDFFEALGNALRGLGYQTAEDIFGKVESGLLRRTETQETVNEKPSLWKATPEDREMAEAYDFQNGIMPYTSEGQIQVPLDVAGTKFSIKKPYDQKKLDKDETLKNDPFTGLPLNANGTVTLYYPTTNELARDLTKTKKLKGHSPTANRIYLTNESSAGAIEAMPGDIDQPVGGANVLLQVDPSMLHVLNEYEDGRKDFFIPIAEGTAFAEKMAMTKLFTLNAPRTKGLHPDRTLSDVTKAITETADKWAKANAAERREMAKDAKTVLRQSHNIEKLFGANSKLEKTNIGEYGLTYNGKKVMSTGLGFASAQKINDMQRATTCPQSGICEDLCLGETSGQNLLYGGDGQFRSGPRLSQYLKTEALVVNPEAFAIAFIKQITAFRKAALDLDYHPAIRLNVTSDFNPKMFEAVINMFPDVTFYDYTKLDTKPIAPNHHLTYSSTGATQLVNGEIIVNKFSNWDRMVDKILAGGKNVAMAFTSRSSMPKFVQDERTGKTFEVWNGDEYDARFLDPVREDGVGLIIGLTNKDNTTKPEDAAKKHNGFFLDYDPERDGETLVIRDQTKMKEGVVKPITFTKKPEKLSLRSDKKAANEAMDLVRKAQKYKPEEGEEAIAFPILFHSGTGDPSKISTYIEPQFGSWVAEVLSGATDEVVDTDQFVPLSYYASKPEWVRMQTARKLDKSLQDITDKDVRESGQLAIVYNVDDKYGDAVNDVYQIGEDGYNGGYTEVTDTYGQKKKLYETDLEESGDYRSKGKTLFGVEPGDIVSKEPITPDIVLVGDALVDFLDQYKKEIEPNARFSLRAPNTKAFKQWFGDSTVVDEDGEPLVVYHGSRKFKGNKFRPDVKRVNRAGNVAGYYFAPDPDQASGYAKNRAKDRYDEGAQVLPAFLSIENPYIAGESRVTPAMIRQYKKELVALNQHMSDENVEEWSETKLPRFTDGRLPDSNALNGDGDAMQRILKAGGYDGFKDGPHWVAFEPTQIKSATGNKGTFNKSNPDIRRSLRTPPKSPEFQAYMAGSKMVDKDGNPQVWYHGTARNISIFRPKQATSIFLTQDPDFAASFAEDSLNWMARNATDELTAEQKAQAIDDAVAKVQKDYDFVQKDDPDFRKLTKHKNDVISDLENNSFSKRKMGEEARDYLMQASKAYFPSAPNIMPLYVRAVKPFDFSNKEHLDMVMRKAQEYFDMSKMEFPEKFLIGKKGLISRGLWQAIEAEPVQRAIRSLGFDSYFIKEGGVKNLAVYSPAQVASATGNVGSFKQRTPTFDEALNLGMTQEEAIEAQKAGDIRLSLRGKKIDKDMEASVDRVTYAREEKGWAKRFTDALSNTSLRQAFLDRYDTIYNNTKRVAASKGEAELFADVSAHSAALLSDNAAGVAAQALGLEHRIGGIPVFRNGGTFIFNDNGKIKGLLEILKPLAAYGDPRVYRYYQTWAGAKRGSRYDKLGVLTPYTPDDYKQAAKFEKEFPEFVTVQKEWDTYNRGLVKYMIDTGVIDRAKGEEWMKHGDYLPFYRQLDDQAAIGPKVFQALSGVKGPKKLKGSEDPLGDFMENMVRNTQAAIESGMKNVAAQRVIRDALFLKEAAKIQGPFKADINTVSVLENGKQVNYQLADAMLAEAMKGLRMAEIPFLAIAAAPANLLRSVVTKMPDFIGANLMRDSLSAYVTSGAKITPVIDTIRNFGAAIADKSPALDILRSYGVIGGYDLAQNVEKSGRDLAKDLRKKTGTRTTKEKILSATGIVPLWGALEKGSAASDAATRMAVFEATMKETGNEVEAAFRAMEVMNFSRKGNSAVIRVLTAITPFLNARMQGLDVLYRAGISPIWPGSTPTEKEKAIAKSFYIRGMTLASLSVMYYMLTHDDDEYKKQEQETRDNNWLIPSLGIKIPIPFEVGVIFKVLPERLTAYFLGNDTGKDLMLSAKRNITSTFGIQLPQAILPAIEVATNYSFFTGREIVGQGMQDIDKQFQINPNTTKLSQAIGNLTSFKTASGTSWGVSPIEIDHLISGYLGGLGMYMAESIDMIIDMNSDNPKASKRFEQMPVIKRFALDPKARGSVTAYYDLKNAVDETVRTDNYLTRTMKMDAKGEYMQDYSGLLMTRDYVNTLEKSMKEFREMKTIIQNSPMSADDKKDALSAIIDVENDLTANIKDIRKAIQ